MLFYIMMYCIVLYCIVLPCIVLYTAILYVVFIYVGCLISYNIAVFSFLDVMINIPFFSDVMLAFFDLCFKRHQVQLLACNNICAKSTMLLRNAAKTTRGTPSEPVGILKAGDFRRFTVLPQHHKLPARMWGNLGRGSDLMGRVQMQFQP